MRKRITLPIVGLILICAGAAFAVVRSASQEIQAPLPAALSDLTAVSMVEVRAGDGSVALSGQFGEATTTGTETERHAQLTAAAGATTAKGTAEIEIVRRPSKIERELEIDVEGLAANTAYTLVVDGQQAAAFRTDGRGRAEVELKSEGAQ